MNLPELTAFIGSKEQNAQDDLAKKVKPVRIPKGDNNLYAVEMFFDLNKNEIYFTNPVPYNDELRYKVYYFGNNPAAAAQCYLVREVDSLNYLLSSVWNDLLLVLRNNDMADSELSQVIYKMQQAGLIFLGSSKGAGSVSLDKITIFKQQNITNLTLTKNTIKIKTNKNEEEEIRFEELIKRSLNDKSKHNRFVLVVPRIAGDEKPLSQYPDYLEIVKKINKLSNESEEEVTGQTGQMCFVCRQVKANVSSEYTASFSRTGINKIFTTTTINSAKEINKSNYDDNYALCNQCYQNMLNGEEIIKNKFSAFIAGERAFIIPEGILDDFDYRYIGLIKESVDFAFHKTAKDWIDRINAEALFLDDKYVLNIIIYRTDGNSVSVLETISDVPLLRFEKIMKLFEQNSTRLKEHLRGMSLGNIYGIIPVKKNKTDQVDIGRVLSLYKALLTGNKIASETLFGYASDALDKGLRQLSKAKIDNYYNLGLMYYANGKEDFYIKKIVMNYLVLIRTCQQLFIFDQSILNIKFEEEDIMDEQNLLTKSLTDSINRMEQFLDKQGFDSKPRALFYLGALINRVAVAQYRKEHESKPILKKISFQGMTERDIICLYEDVLEKLKQYKIWTLYSDQLINKFHDYYGNLDKTERLTEHANIFYLMSGYAYMVGNKAPDLTKDEQKAIQDISIDDEIVTNDQE